MPLDVSILGSGIYTPAEAARLAGIRTRQVLRWTGGDSSFEPLWQSHYRSRENGSELSFRDLTELRVVKALRAKGLSLQAIRFAIDCASRQFAVDHPLSDLRFKTDGQEILLHALENEDHLVSLSRKRPGQRVFAEIVRQSLADLEYEGQEPVLWRPHAARAVVIDPRRSFGTPLLDASGVATRVLREEHSQGASVDYLSRLYEIDPQQVRAAIEFERSLDAKQGS